MEMVIEISESMAKGGDCTFYTFQKRLLYNSFFYPLDGPAVSLPSAVSPCTE